MGTEGGEKDRDGKGEGEGKWNLEGELASLTLWGIDAPVKVISLWTLQNSERFLRKRQNTLGDTSLPHTVDQSVSVKLQRTQRYT